MFGEQEVGGLAGAGVRVRALRAAVLGPGVERGYGGDVEWDGTLGAELAERDMQPGAGEPVVDDAAELEVEALAQAQSGAAQQQDRGAGEQVVEVADCGHQRGVGVGG